MEGSVNASFTVNALLRPHAKALVFGALATLGVGLANLLEPWPLKIVLDNALKSRPIHGWLNRLIFSAAGSDNVRVLKFAALAVVAIAAFGAVCTYVQKGGWPGRPPVPRAAWQEEIFDLAHTPSSSER